MLSNIEALVIDLQDIGARLYTYIWTVKLCMEACMEAGIPVWILDRPNPVGRLPLDGPVMKEEYFHICRGSIDTSLPPDDNWGNVGLDKGKILQKL